MIVVDWGTSSFRAFRLNADGSVRDRRAAPLGIMAIGDGDFAAALQDQIAPWLAEGEDRVLLSGMIGSRQGWREAPYLACPAGAADLAAALIDLDFPGAQVKLVPGLSARRTPLSVPEVMRGEETQLVGLLATGGEGDPATASTAPQALLVCLPGTHSKWARLADRRIAGFTTHMTGEVFAVLRDHSILGRLMPKGLTGASDASADAPGFELGLARSADAGGLLHHLFGVRTLGLFGDLPATEAAAYLSGLLIGHELRAAMPASAEVRLVGAAPLCALYARAIAVLGGRAVLAGSDTAAAGLAHIGGLAGWN